MKSQVLLIFAAMLVLQLRPAMAQADAVHAAFISNNELVVKTSPAHRAQELTRDGVPKSLPVWSKDGSKIAFVRKAQSNHLADLVVVSANGTVLHEIAFRQLDGQSIGMRFIERLEWVDERVLAVSGSINPSTVENALIDVDSGAQLNDYLSDGFHFSISPDGAHVAYSAPIPHFITEEERRPQLCVDDECLFDHPRARQAPKTRMEFNSAPVWSPDSKEVAVVVADTTNQIRELLRRPIKGSETYSRLPAEATQASGLHIAWVKNGIFVAGNEGLWHRAAGQSQFTAIRSNALMPDTVVAWRLRVTEIATLEKDGAIDVDLWCASCELRDLPRRSGQQ